MDLSTIKKIEDLTDRQTVNKYLELGWTLLHVYSTAYDTQYPGCNHQTAHFVVGWVEGEAKYPSESDEWDGVSNPFKDWH